jgi:hypothetical protein
LEWFTLEGTVNQWGSDLVSRREEIVNVLEAFRSGTRATLVDQGYDLFGLVRVGCEVV